MRTRKKSLVIYINALFESKRKNTDDSYNKMILCAILQCCVPDFLTLP